MNFDETMTAGLEAADKLLESCEKGDIRNMLAAAYMLGLAQGANEVLTCLQTALVIQSVK